MYKIALLIIMTFAANAAHACFLCFGSVCPWREACLWQSGVAGSNDCGNACLCVTNCYVNIRTKGPNGKLQTSCVSPTALYPPNPPLQAERLPGTIGIDVWMTPDGGVVVDRVLRDSPAYRVGIRAGDQLTFVNGSKAASLSYERVTTEGTGDGVSIRLSRNGRELAYRLTAVRLDTLLPTQTTSRMEIALRGL